MKKLLLSGAASALAAAAAQPKPRAVAGTVKADASDPNALFKELKAAHEELKAKVLSKVDDAVTKDELNTLNTTISNLQASLDAQTNEVNALKLNGAGGESEAIYGDMKADAGYTNLFKNFMRKGDAQKFEAGIADLDVNAAVSVGTDADGGYLAPIEWDRTITTSLQQLSPIRANAQVINIQGTGFDRIYSDGQVGSGWVGETAARPQTTTPGLSTLRFETGEIYANPAITQKALDDIALNLEEWIGGEVDGEFARQENIAFLGGDGVNKPFGILTYITGGANAAKHPFGAIAKRATAASGVVSEADIMRLIYDTPAERVTANMKFFMERSTTATLRLLTNADGDFIWQPGLQADQPARLAGHPVVEVPAMDAIAVGNVPVLFGDMRMTYLVINRVGTRVLRDPYTNKPFVHFYTTRRVGGGVQNPEYMKALEVSV